MAEAVPQAIVEAVGELWAFSGPRSDNRFESQQFLRLKATCAEQYGVGTQFWFSFTLSEILRSLGCPLYLPKNKLHLALPVREAAERLHRALNATKSTVVHLCPLDWADDPPEVKFGTNRLKLLSSVELKAITDAPRLARAFPDREIDWDKLSQFYWLVVEEKLPITTEPGERTNPFMYQIMGDLGAIEAHENRFPEVVEQALFLLLLAPWEDWSEAHEVDWRGFRIPWVYSISDDLCVSLKAPPPEDDLTLLPKTYTDFNGEPVDVEEPARFMTSTGKVDLGNLVTDLAWEQLSEVLRSPLFAAPVRHFFVRAFHAQGIDEFMAHLTVIEAALGLQSDYGRKPKGDPRNNGRPTDIMSKRVSALLGDGATAIEYKDLFELRSAYVHGRPMSPISSIDRFRARRLARRVVVALAKVALDTFRTTSGDREQFLIALGSPQRGTSDALHDRSQSGKSESSEQT